MSMSHKAKSVFPAKEILACCAVLTVLSGAIKTTQAADLGANCCVDLQERVAELEATTVRKGNRRVSLSLSPYINRAILEASHSLPYQLSQLNDEELNKAINRLASYSHAPFVHTMLEADKRFGNALMSCPQQGGNETVTTEGQCHWFKLTGTISERDSNSINPGFNALSGGFAGGVQFALQDQWRFGFGGALERSNIEISDATQDYSTSDGTRYTVGAVVKNQWGAMNGYFSLTGSQGLYKTSRTININNIGDSAKSHQKNSSVRTNARFTYLFDTGNFYLKPGLDLSGQYLHLGGYSEIGAGGANITQSSSHTWVFGVTPSVEIGTSFQQEGTTFRPYVKAGVSFLNDDDLDIQAIIGDSATPFATLGGTHEFGKTSATLEAGLTVLTAKGIDLKLNYEAAFSDDTISHSGGIKASFKF